MSYRPPPISAYSCRRAPLDINATVFAIMKPLVGLPLFDAASFLIVAISEIVDQADDRPAAWEAILCAIAANRAETLQ